METFLDSTIHANSEPENAVTVAATPKVAKAGKLPPVSLIRTVTSGVWNKAAIGLQVLRENGQGCSFVIGNGDLAIALECEAENDRSLMSNLIDKHSICDYPEHFTLATQIEKLGPSTVYNRLEFKALEWLSSAMSTDKTRYNLCAVYFDAGKWVATDGHRLHLLENMPTIFECPTLVPSAAIQALLVSLKWIKHGNVMVSESAECVRFSIVGPTSQVHITSRKVEGKFPDYTQVIPVTQDATRYFGEAQALNARLKFAPKRGTDKARSYLLDCAGIVHAIPTTGDAYPLPLVTVAAEPKKEQVCLRADYLADAVSGVSGKVSVYPFGGLEPVVIRSGNQTAIVMPMRA